MLLSTVLAIALASAALAAPQQTAQGAPQCPTTITTSYPVSTKTISKCTATSTFSIPPTKTCKPKTVTTTETTTKYKGTTTIKVTATATPSCPSPTCPSTSTRLISVIGFEANNCDSAWVYDGDYTNAEMLSLTIPDSSVPSREGNCAKFTSGDISSLIFTSVPSNLGVSNSCKLFAFKDTNCDEENGYVRIDLSSAQRGRCHDPNGFNNINSLQIRC